MGIIKNCDNCRFRGYIDRDGSSEPVLICNNIWMMSYGDEKTVEDVFECIGCVGWQEDVCKVTPVGEGKEGIEAIRAVTEYFGLDTEFWIERMNEPVTVSELFMVLNNIGNR